MNSRQKSHRDSLCTDGKVIAGILFVYGLLEIEGITCPIKWVTGCSCAGCGMSRAWQAALKLDFASAIHFHPLFWVPAIIASVLLLKEAIPPRVSKTICILSLAALLIVYFFRLCDPHDMVVVFRPNQGMIVQLLRHLYEVVR